MNPDECRKAFEEWWNEPNERSRRVNLIQDRYDDALAAWQAAWSSRTESKPVTREASWNEKRSQVNRLVKELQGKPDSEKMGYSVSPGGILNAYREGDLSFPDAVRAIESLQLSAPQSPVVPGDVVTTTSGVAVTIIESDRELARKVHEMVDEYTDCDEENALRIALYRESFNLPAPQSPVVPGVSELAHVLLDYMEDGPELVEAAKAIHAHLLATSGRESREDRDFRLVVDGEVVEKDDEFLEDDCKTWTAIGADFRTAWGVGITWRDGGVLKPLRRPIKPEQALPATNAKEPS